MLWCRQVTKPNSGFAENSETSSVFGSFSERQLHVVCTNIEVTRDLRPLIESGGASFLRAKEKFAAACFLKTKSAATKHTKAILYF